MTSKTINRYIRALLFRGTAVLLMTLLLMVSGIEAFHDHHSTHFPLEKTVPGKYPKQQLSKAAASCQICMYLSAQQTQISYGIFSPCLLAFSTDAVKVNTDFVVDPFSAKVSSWTNKGPPSFC